jgi:ABC-type nitrate/sulfonate/bicarbonate transport system ATPase subunit
VGDAAAKIKSQRDLTVLITTHYMDEADKLCDRIRHRRSRQARGARFAGCVEGVDSGRDPETVTLDDVFVYYTGRTCAMRCRNPSAADSPFMIRR